MSTPGKIFLSIFSLLISLFLLLLFNTFMLSSKQPETAPIDSILIDAAAAFNFSKAITFRTVSSGNTAS